MEARNFFSTKAFFCGQFFVKGAVSTFPDSLGFRHKKELRALKAAAAAAAAGWSVRHTRKFLSPVRIDAFSKDIN